IYGFPGVGIDDSSTSAFYYREGLEAKGFGEFSDWNCEPYDCTRLEEADFKDLLERPEENWADVWYCATDYAWPNLTWEKESRFGYTVTVTVQEGDSLWKLADLVYGDGYFWTQIYDKNKECIGGDPNLIHPGMDLEVVLNASLADYAAKGDIYQQEGDFLLTEWKKGLSGTEIQSFYRRLLADDLWNGATWRQKGMPEDYNRRINDWMIADLDGNGQKDMIVIAGDGGADCPGEIWLYLNEEPAYVLKDETAYYEENFGFSSFCINPLMADLDNDGNLELLFGVITDGVGRAICLFRHVGNRWEECQTELPDYNDSWLESGIGIRVNTIDTTKNVYEAYCPYLEERREFTAKSWKEYFVNTDSGEQKTGSNVWGMYGFQCVDYKGKNALQFKEKLMWDGSYVLGGVIGDAVFILNWDADGVCRVADWWAEGDD
nr:FG-GAP-like repeat-containing protein [Lachnospiraceae bacterium]